MEDSRSSTIEEVWVEVLASIFESAVPKFFKKTSRSWLDVFEHRLEFAKYEPDVPAVIQSLANKLSIQGLSVDVNLVEKLRENEELALEILRRWTKYLALKAYVRYKERRR
ncbi:MAG: hypothetical protein QXP56_06990 [Archaeoglobaceae archaeon]